MYIIIKIFKAIFLLVLNIVEYFFLFYFYLEKFRRKVLLRLAINLSFKILFWFKLKKKTYKASLSKVLTIKFEK